MIGEDTAVASLCDRANEAGTRALRELLLGKDVAYFLEVPLPFGRIHIDGAFMVLDEKLCLVHEPTFEIFPCRLYEAGKAWPRHVMFLEFLAEREGTKGVGVTTVGPGANLQPLDLFLRAKRQQAAERFGIGDASAVQNSSNPMSAQSLIGRHCRTMSTGSGQM